MASALSFPALLSFFPFRLPAIAVPPSTSADKSEFGEVSVWQILQSLLTLMFAIAVWMIRSVSAYLPPSVPKSGFLHGFSESFMLINNAEDETVNEKCGARLSESDPVGRALSQVLALVNDVPVSSEKYEFARTLAEKIIQQNINQGSPRCMELNRHALAAGFSRTLKLLTLSLEMMQQQQEFGAQTWPWKLIRPVCRRAVAAFSQMLPLESLRTPLITMFSPHAEQATISYGLSPVKTITGAQDETDCTMAEKFAQELIWISQKLKECSASQEAIMQWSSAFRLACLSLYAEPRVQSSMLRLNVMLLRYFFSEEIKATRELKLNFLLLWLPLLCRAKNGNAIPILSHGEKAEVVSNLEGVILSLPCSDQEVVLASWLHEYSLSSSDWLNLQRCFERWFQASFMSSLQIEWSSK